MAMTKPKSSQIEHRGESVQGVLDSLNAGGASTDRPSGAVLYSSFFDTTLNKPIWKTEAGWVDSSGTIV